MGGWTQEKDGLPHPVLLVESLPIIAHKRGENVLSRNAGPLHCSDEGGRTSLPLLDALLDALLETSLQASFKTLFRLLRLL